MIRAGINRLANYQSIRGLATPKDTGARLIAVSNIQKITQSINKETLAKYGRVALIELRPPTPMEIPKAIGDAVRMVRQRNWKNLTVREAWLNTLVATEVVCWFFVGEVIGKGTLIGYQV